MPDWPALLSAEQAAAYCGMSRGSFELCVEACKFPKPVDLPIRRRLWQRAGLDAAIAKGSGAADDRETRRPPGQGDKVVKRTLADGTVKEYRYPRARRQERQPAGGLRTIFNEYSESPEFKRLCKAWRERKLWLFRLIEAELGWMTIADLEARVARTDFYALRDKHADLPHRADKMMQALASTLSWAYDRGRLTVNHAQRIKPLIDPRLSPHQDKCFTEEQEEVLLERLPNDLRQVFVVGLYTGLRRGDLIALTSSALRSDGWLVCKPSKTSTSTGIETHFPVFEMPPLSRLIGALDRQRPRLLMTDTGLEWNETNLSHRWRRQMIKLEMRGMRLHDIRHTTENRLAAAGCTEAERNAITGRPMATGSGRAYVARSRELALNAYRKWRRQIEGESNVTRLENGGKLPAKS